MKLETRTARFVSAAGFVFMALCAAGVLAGQATVSPEELIQLNNSWDPGENYHGAKLALQLTLGSGNAVAVRFTASGLPHDHIYTLVSLPITSDHQIELIRGITLDATGRALCSGKPGQCGNPKQKNSPLAVRLAPIAGEPLRLGLVAADNGSIRAVANQVAHPLTTTDRGCRLEATVLEPRSSMLRVTANGFPPGAPFTLTSESSGKATTLDVKADNKGHYSSGLVPTRPSGTATSIRLQAKAPACQPSLLIPWSVAR